MKVAIYARVSTEKQEKQETVKSQLTALRDYAKEKKYSIYQEYIDEGRYRGALGGTTGELFTSEQRGQHAKDALKRLIAYRNNESLERFNPKPPTYDMDNNVFRTAEYDDFIDTLGADGSMIEMLGEWDELEDWQREAAEEAGWSEDDWW